MHPETIRQLMAAIGKVDHTVRAKERHTPLLQGKLVPVERYSRARLFRHMSRQEPVLFHSCRVPLRREGEPRRILLQCLKDSFPLNETVRLWVGLSQNRRFLRVREIADQWDRGRAVLGITDLQIRGTELERLIDTRRLTEFNVLLCGAKNMAWQELLTLVISTKHYVTDSHSDDPDGSNHCFVGKKLWLMWDTFEGLSRGLQDVERVKACGQCRFDLDTFLSLRSSRWLTISEGQTLFLPGNLTHKVYTLEHYLGVGCFYVGLPNCLQTLSRWIEHGPLWSRGGRRGPNGRLLDQITDALIRKIREIRCGSSQIQRRWGLAEMDAAIRRWQVQTPSGTKIGPLRDPRLARLMRASRQNRPVSGH
jgi:hypothetical protein